MHVVKASITAATALAMLIGSAEARRHHGASLDELTPKLRDKVTEIENACHSRLISAYRPGARVAGSGRPSLHSTYPSRAADMAGNPKCIYSHLSHWPGGYSIDYGRVQHVHISYSPPRSGQMAGREWHARFRHYAGGYRHQHYAQRFDRAQRRVYMVHQRRGRQTLQPAGDHFNGHG